MKKVSDEKVRFIKWHKKHGLAQEWHKNGTSKSEYVLNVAQWHNFSYITFYNIYIFSTK